MGVGRGLFLCWVLWAGTAFGQVHAGASPDPRPSPSPEPPGSAEPRRSPGYGELSLLLRVTPAAELVSLLGKQKAALLTLPPAERLALLTEHKETLGSKVAGFLLNVLIFPGSGSLYQGDKGFGYPLLAGALLGAGCVVGGAIHSLSSFSGSGVPLMIAGAAIWYTSALIGLVRPWFYEGIRYSVLRDFFAHPERFGALPPSRAPRLLPTLIAQPLGLSGAERSPPSGRTLLGAGLLGSF